MITLTKAKIVRNVQIPGPVMRNKLVVVALLTPKVARELGDGWTLSEKEYHDAAFSHAVPISMGNKLAELKLQGISVARFRAHRVGDGDKQPKQIMLSFVVEHNGTSFDIQEHLLRAGQGEGTCAIDAPEQQQLPLKKGKL